MKAALIDNENNVLNVIVWDDTCTAPDGTTPLVLEDDAAVSPGWAYEDGEFIAPPEPEPEPGTEPVELTPLEKLASIGLTADDLRALLAEE